LDKIFYFKSTNIVVIFFLVNYLLRFVPTEVNYEDTDVCTNITAYILCSGLRQER